jgi:predicted Zn-dependent protease
MTFWSQQIRPRIALLSLFLSAGIPLLFSCQTSPTGRKQLALVSDAQVEQMGEQAFAEMKKSDPIDQDPKVNRYVDCIAGKITGALPEKRSWEVVVFQKDEANAFALPGGKIGVYSGLLKVAKTQGQVAAVLGHEVGHVLAEHPKERVSEQLAAQGGLTVLEAIMGNPQDTRHKLLLAALGLGAEVGVLLPHSRRQESEADLIGLDLMAKAGFDPKQALELWKNMEAEGGPQPPAFLSDHPSHGARIENLNQHMGEALELYQKSPKDANCRLD